MFFKPNLDKTLSDKIWDDYAKFENLLFEFERITDTSMDNSFKNKHSIEDFFSGVKILKDKLRLLESYMATQALLVVELKNKLSIDHIEFVKSMIMIRVKKSKNVLETIDESIEKIEDENKIILARNMVDLYINSLTVYSNLFKKLGGK